MISNPGLFSTLSVLWTFLIASQTLDSAEAFPFGTGSCAAGNGAIGGVHLEGQVTTGSIEEGEFQVDINGDVLVPGVVYTMFPGEVNLLRVSGLNNSTFKGHVFRLETSDDFALEALPGDPNTQRAAACVEAGVAGLDHANADDKVEAVAGLSLTELIEAIDMDVTLVVRTSGGISIYYHSTYVLSSLDTTAVPTFSQPIPAPAGTPFMSPVEPPIEFPSTAPSPGIDQPSMSPVEPPIERPSMSISPSVVAPVIDQPISSSISVSPSSGLPTIGQPFSSPVELPFGRPSTSISPSNAAPNAPSLSIAPNILAPVAPSLSNAPVGLASPVPSFSPDPSMLPTAFSADTSSPTFGAPSAPSVSNKPTASDPSISGAPSGLNGSSLSNAPSEAAPSIAVSPSFQEPSVSEIPSTLPTGSLSSVPSSLNRTVSPTAMPTTSPTVETTAAPTFEDSAAPSTLPISSSPTTTPSMAPTELPASPPTPFPSMSYSDIPTRSPNISPTRPPTARPTKSAATPQPTKNISPVFNSKDFPDEPSFAPSTGLTYPPAGPSLEPTGFPFARPVSPPIVLTKTPSSSSQTVAPTGNQQTWLPTVPPIVGAPADVPIVGSPASFPVDAPSFVSPAYSPAYSPALGPVNIKPNIAPSNRQQDISESNAKHSGSNKEHLSHVPDGFILLDKGRNNGFGDFLNKKEYPKAKFTPQQRTDDSNVSRNQPKKSKKKQKGKREKKRDKGLDHNSECETSTGKKGKNPCKTFLRNQHAPHAQSPTHPAAVPTLFPVHIEAGHPMITEKASSDVLGQTHGPPEYNRSNALDSESGTTYDVLDASTNKNSDHNEVKTATLEEALRSHAVRTAQKKKKTKGDEANNKESKLRRGTPKLTKTS